MAGKTVGAVAERGDLFDGEARKAAQGKILVIEPLGYEKDVETVHGVSDAVVANVWVLVSKDKTTEYLDTYLFNTALRSQTKNKVGEVVVGRLTQGQKKQGKNAPWILAAPSEGDLEKASQFWAKRAVTAAPSESAPAGEDDWGDDEGDSF